MKKHKLGRSDLEVSLYCLGSMTWGTQNSPEEAFEQIDYALDQGVNIIDTAEMYPTTPMSAETAGDTEAIIGQWVARSGRRNDVIIATKIVGAGNKNVGRDGAPITPDTLRMAIDGSLKRLQTDFIDLYQLHWPNRGSYHFRKTWDFDPSKQELGEEARMLEVLQTIGELVADGKVRHFGLSNESAWGTAKFLQLSETHGLPRVISIQNEYSLLHRIYDTDLAELSHHEDIGLLAYSPLSAGILTGKYQGDVTPPGSRRTFSDTLNGRLNPYAKPSIDAYVELARDHGLDPTHLALAFCASRPFMGSIIIGATTMDQLRTNLAAADVTLSSDILEQIAQIRRENPQPM